MTPRPQHLDPPRLVGDVGGTNVRFAIHTRGNKPHRVASLKVARFRSLGDAAAAYIKRLPARERPDRGAFAVAAPVLGNRIRLTNSPWSFSTAALRRRLGFSQLDVINDFTAIALAVPRLVRSEKRTVGGGVARAGEAIGVIGPGTGLGVSGLVPCDGRYVPLASEGGKVTLAPSDEFEAGIIRMVREETGHVSAERLLSGDGLARLHHTIALLYGQNDEALAPEAITRRALAGSCPVCVKTVQTFCALLGTVASDLALTLGAFGGIYIAGGIVPQFGPLFHRSRFRARFESKGRFSDYLAGVPTFVVTHPAPGLLGLATLPDPR